MGAEAKPAPTRKRTPAPEGAPAVTAVGVAELTVPHRELAHNAAAAVIAAAARAEEELAHGKADLLVIALPAGELGPGVVERIRAALVEP